MKAEKLAWVSQALPSGPLREDLGSHIASIRYRILIPARQFQRRGIENIVVNPMADIDALLKGLSGCRAVVFGKLSIFEPDAFRQSARQHLALLARAQSIGVRVAADICDDRFDHPLLGSYWRDIVRLADKIVTSTAELAELVRALGAQDVEIIPDPVEGRKGSPHSVSGQVVDQKSGGVPTPLRLLWYGHQSNLDEVAEFLPALDRWAAQRGAIVLFQVVTASGFGVEKWVESREPLALPVQLQHVEWSPAAVASLLKACDFVVIPATLQHQMKRSKSANRVTEALHAGRYVLAHPVPSYREFSECAWIQDNLIEGLNWALEHPEQVITQIEKGQRIISDAYLPESVAGRWLAALDLEV